MPGTAANRSGRRATVIGTAENAGSIGAKVATDAIPVVYKIGADPVKLGLVESLSRPGGNATGVSYFTHELGPKRLGLMRDWRYRHFRPRQSKEPDCRGCLAGPGGGRRPATFGTAREQRSGDQRGVSRDD